MNPSPSQDVARLHVAIDGYNLALPQGTGVATYGYTLARVLAEAGHRVDGVFGIDAGRDPTMREILFFDRLGRPQILSDEQRRKNARHRNRIALNPFLRLQARDVPLGRVERAGLVDRFPAFDRLVTSPRLFDYAHRYFIYYGRFARLRVKNPPPIMHWTYPVPIKLEGSLNVFTLHDLVPLKLPFSTLDAKGRYRQLVAECIRHAAHICTVSETSRNDILAEFNIDPTSVSNCFQATVPPIGWHDEGADTDAAIVRGVLGLEPDNYFLFFGAIEPKKNVGRLIEAFLSVETETPLVLAGAPGWQNAEELRLLRTSEQSDPQNGRRIAARVIRLEHLPRPLLLRLMRGAKAVVFPSLYEGFGLPVLEAMQLGTPVITSNVASLPEIGGNAVKYVDPYDVRSIAAAIAELDRDLPQRRHLANAGMERAKAFSANAYLARLETMYGEVLRREKYPSSGA